MVKRLKVLPNTAWWFQRIGYDIAIRLFGDGQWLLLGVWSVDHMWDLSCDTLSKWHAGARLGRKILVLSSECLKLQRGPRWYRKIDSVEILYSCISSVGFFPILDLSPRKPRWKKIAHRVTWTEGELWADEEEDYVCLHYHESLRNKIWWGDYRGVNYSYPPILSKAS